MVGVSLLFEIIFFPSILMLGKSVLGQVSYLAGAYREFCSMNKRLVVFLPPPPLPLDAMLVHSSVTPSTKFAGTHLYT